MKPAELIDSINKISRELGRHLAAAITSVSADKRGVYCEEWVGVWDGDYFEEWDTSLFDGEDKVLRDIIAMEPRKHFFRRH